MNTKEQLFYLNNMVNSAYKNTVPSNVRLLAKSIVHPTNITENNFSDKEKQILKQAYLNSINRVNSPTAVSAKNRAQYLQKAINNNSIYSDSTVPSMVKHGKNVSAEQELYDLLPSVYSKSIQYPDYPNKGHSSDNSPVISTLTNPTYAMATTIGRANYQADNKGNVHVKDNYNFGNIDTKAQADFDKLSPLYRAAELIGNKFGKSMPVDINLGNVKGK